MHSSDNFFALQPFMYKYLTLNGILSFARIEDTGNICHESNLISNVIPGMDVGIINNNHGLPKPVHPSPDVAKTFKK